VIDELKHHGVEIPLVHMANSSALFNFPEARADLVRPGLSLFGYPPGPHLDGKWPLRPAMSLHTEIVFFKGIRKGTGVGYMHTWSAPRDGWLATLPMGYGDGYPRILSNRADVLIEGKRYPVVGNISMDQMMIWLGDDKYGVGEPVTLLGAMGSERIGAWELATKAAAPGSDASLTADRLADLQDQIRSIEQRMTSIREEVLSLEREAVDESDLVKALSIFDPVWESLNSRERHRVMHLLIDRIAYDGRDGGVTVSFRSLGIKALCSEANMVYGGEHDE